MVAQKMSLVFLFVAVHVFLRFAEEFSDSGLSIVEVLVHFHSTFDVTSFQVQKLMSGIWIHHQLTLLQTNYPGTFIHVYSGFSSAFVYFIELDLISNLNYFKIHIF